MRPRRMLFVSRANQLGLGSGFPPLALATLARHVPEEASQPAVFGIARSRAPRRELFSRTYAAATLQTPRGCPFDCTFCSMHPVHGKRYRTKPIETIDRDLTSVDRPVVLLVDDNFLGAGAGAEQRPVELLANDSDYREYRAFHRKHRESLAAVGR